MRVTAQQRRYNVHSSRNSHLATFTTVMRSRHWYILQKLVLFSAMLFISIFTWHTVQRFVQRYMSSMKLRRRDHDGIGVPFNEECANSTNTYLNDTSELNKGAFAAGTTLMTLLPSLLTFAPIPTAKIRDSIHTSPWLTLFTAGLIFGLPVTQYSSVPGQRSFEPEEFFAHQNSEPGNVATLEGAEQSNTTAAAVRAKLFPSTGRVSLRRLMYITCLVGFGQWMLFLVLIVALPKIDGFTVIWACEDVSGGLYCGWLALTYALSSFCLLYWNSSSRTAQVVLHCIPEQQYPFMLETRSFVNITTTRGSWDFPLRYLRAAFDLRALDLIKMASLM